MEQPSICGLSDFRSSEGCTSDTRNEFQFGCNRRNGDEVRFRLLLRCALLELSRAQFVFDFNGHRWRTIRRCKAFDEVERCLIIEPMHVEPARFQFTLDICPGVGCEVVEQRRLGLWRCCDVLALLNRLDWWTAVLPLASIQELDVFRK